MVEILASSIVIELSGSARIVIELARSSFATPDRVEAWGKLTYRYRNAGVYCPLLLPTIRNGGFHICLRVDDLCFVAWAEEHKAYPMVEEVLDELKAGGLSEQGQKVRTRLNGDEWLIQVGAHLGRVCAGLSMASSRILRQPMCCITLFPMDQLMRT